MPENVHGWHIRIPSNGVRITVVVLCINALLFVANLYLSNGYVSRSTYEKDLSESNARRENLNTELRNIAIELRGIKDHMLGDEKQDKRIDDLEIRMRELEKKR